MKIYKSLFVILIVVTTALLTAIAVFPNRSYTAFSPTPQNDPDQDAATPIQRGVMTERQRQHSRLYGHYSQWDSLMSDLKTSDTDINVRIGSRNHVELSPTGAIPKLENIIPCVGSESDAVVVGIIKNKNSQLTEEEDFIFTDYEINVEEVIKNNTNAPIDVNRDLIVTRPGGKVQIGKRIVQIEHAQFPPFKQGDRYLLFLRYIPNTGSYSVVDRSGSFKIGADDVQSLSSSVVIDNTLRTTPNSFIAQVRSLVFSGCKEKGGGK